MTARRPSHAPSERTHEDVESTQMILSELKAGPVLDGYRGSQPVKNDVFVWVLLAVSRFVTDCDDDVDQIDLNPVVAK